MKSALINGLIGVLLFASYLMAQSSNSGIRPGPNAGEFIVSSEKLKGLMEDTENKSDTIEMLRATIRIKDSLATQYEKAIVAGAKHIESLNAIIIKQDSLYQGYKSLYNDFKTIAWPTPSNWSFISSAGLLWNKDRLEPVGQLTAFRKSYGLAMLFAPSLYGVMAQYQFRWR